MSQIDSQTIILCPGQGAQHVGMGKAWADAEPAAAEVFRKADAALGLDLSSICFAGPEDQVNRTDIAQAAIYTTSVACWKALKSRSLVGDPLATAGLSLGEYTALHLAGAFSFEDGLQLVRQRGIFMQEAAQATPSGMVALVGADETQANQLCDDARGDGVLVPANFNCPGQIVLSGSSEACQRALTVAEKMGVRAVPITVAGAFHSPLMQSAADRMAEALDKVDFASPSIPVLSNVTGQPHDQSDISSIKQLLVQQITNPVRWSADIQWLVGNVQGNFTELAPGKVLAGLMRRIDRKASVQNFAEPTT